MLCPRDVLLISNLGSSFWEIYSGSEMVWYCGPPHPQYKGFVALLRPVLAGDVQKLDDPPQENTQGVGTKGKQQPGLEDMFKAMKEHLHGLFRPDDPNEKLVTRDIPQKTLEAVFVDFGEDFGGRVSLKELAENPDLWPRGLAIILVVYDRLGYGPYAAWRNPADGNICCIVQREPVFTGGGKQLIETYRDFRDATSMFESFSMFSTNYKEARERLDRLAAEMGIEEPLMYACDSHPGYYDPVLIEDETDWARLEVTYSRPLGLSINLLDGAKYRVQTQTDGGRSQR